MSDVITIMGRQFADLKARASLAGIDMAKAKAGLLSIDYEVEPQDLGTIPYSESRKYGLSKSGSKNTGIPVEEMLRMVHTGEIYNKETGEVVYSENGSRLEFVPVYPGSHIFCRTLDCCFFMGDGTHIKTEPEQKGNGWAYYTAPQTAFYIGIFRTNGEVPIGGSPAVFSFVDTDVLPRKIAVRVNNLSVPVSALETSGDGTSEAEVYLKNRTIHTVNEMRHALRIASYNTFGASWAEQNWAEIKKHVQKFGVDFVGFQEIKNTAGVSGTFPDAMRSWDLEHFGTTETTYGTATASTSRFQLASCEEHAYTTNGSEVRRWTKCEFKLPMYKHRWSSDELKISIYNTQWELRESTALAQAQELAAVMAVDTNPFVILVADTNDDFSFERKTWKAMEDAGFRPLFDLESATLAVGRDPIDNIFVNNRISCLETNVVDGTAAVWKTYDGGPDSQISDHDMIFADVKLDYDKIHIVKVQGDGCTITCSNGHPKWFDHDSGVITYTITPEAGKTVTNKVIYDIIDCTGNKYPAGIVTINGNTVTVDTSKVYGDMAIKATAT